MVALITFIYDETNYLKKNRNFIRAHSKNVLSEERFKKKKKKTFKILLKK